MDFDLNLAENGGFIIWGIFFPLDQIARDDARCYLWRLGYLRPVLDEFKAGGFQARTVRRAISIARRSLSFQAPWY